MNYPTRYYRGKQQAKIDGIWCDVPYGTNTRRVEFHKDIQQKKLIMQAKRVLEGPPEAPLMIMPKFAPHYAPNSLAALWAKYDTLLGEVNRVTLITSHALPLTRKDNHED